MKKNYTNQEVNLPSAEEIRNELGQVETLDDFFEKRNICPPIFSNSRRDVGRGDERSLGI